MPFSTRYVFVVSMDVDPAKEALFNEVYDTEHVPFLKQVPGVRAVTRMQGEQFRHQVGGEAIAKKHEAARYTAIYEIDSPDVLTSPEWRVQGERGAPVHEEPEPRRLQGALRRVPDAWFATRTCRCDGK